LGSRRISVTAGKPSLLEACRGPVDPIELVKYGLQRSFNHLDPNHRIGHRCDRKVVDAGERSWWLHRHDTSRHRRRIRRHVDWSHLCRRKLHRWLDHVGRRRNDSAAAISITFQAILMAGSHGECRERTQRAACSGSPGRGLCVPGLGYGTLGQPGAGERRGRLVSSVWALVCLLTRHSRR